MFIASAGLILLGVGLGQLGIGQMVNSVYSEMMTFTGHPTTKELIDTSVSSMYISSGVGIVILSALAYVVPKIINH